MPRFTYSGVVSTLALVLAMSGGAYAAAKLPKNSVGAAQIKKNAVEASKIKSGAVDSSKIKDGSLTGADLNVSSIGTVPSATTAATASGAMNAIHANAAGGLDKVIYRTAQGTIPVNAPVTTTATCDAGYKAVGGGGKVGDVDSAYIIDTYPEGSTGWTARAAAGPGVTVPLTAYVVCVPAGAPGRPPPVGGGVVSYTPRAMGNPLGDRTR